MSDVTRAAREAAGRIYENLTFETMVVELLAFRQAALGEAAHEADYELLNLRNGGARNAVRAVRDRIRRLASPAPKEDTNG